MEDALTPGWTILPDLAAPKDEVASPAAHKRAVPELKVQGKLEGARIVRIAFAPGDELASHSAPVPILVMGQVGSVALSVGEGPGVEEYELVPGSAIHIPARITHSLRADGAATVTLILLTD